MVKEDEKLPNWFKSVVPIPEDVMNHAFLFAETDKESFGKYKVKHPDVDWEKLLQKPDFDSVDENNHRQAAIRWCRYHMLKRVKPFPGTDWYRCKLETSLEFANQTWLPWQSKDDETKHTKPLSLDNIMLVGYEWKNLSVMEGNHRMTRWMQEKFPSMTADVIVGITKFPCDFVPTDYFAEQTQDI